MNNWLNQLERKYGRFGIPNLTNILVGGQILVLAIELFVNQTVSVWLALSRYFLLRGQIWRIITFAFIPSYGGSILSAVLGIYFTWFIGMALEREWGDFRYTVYLLSGMLGTVLACLLTGVTGSTYCLSLSLLLAFAMLFGGLYLYNRLDEPPSYPDSYRQENGQMIQQPGGVNPNYLQGKQRVVYEILYDLLPDGQGMQILSGEVA